MSGKEKTYQWKGLRFGIRNRSCEHDKQRGQMDTEDGI